MDHTAWITPGKEAGMDTVRRYSVFIDRGWGDTDDRFGRRDRRAYPLLSTPQG